VIVRSSNFVLVVKNYQLMWAKEKEMKVKGREGGGGRWVYVFLFVLSSSHPREFKGLSESSNSSVTCLKMDKFGW